MAKEITLDGFITKITRAHGKPMQIIVQVPSAKASEIPSGPVRITVQEAQDSIFGGEGGSKVRGDRG